MPQQDVQKLQDLYNQWCELAPQLEKSLEQWKQAESLLKPLSDFYGSEQWHELYDNFNGELDTQGNYSILSEDALWNAFHEQRQLALEWLKTITESLTKE